MAILTLLVVALGAALVIRHWEHDRIRQRRTQISEYLARNHAYAIRQSIEHALTVTYALAALVRQGNGALAQFDAIATEMLPFYPGVSALALAPAGVIQHIVPLPENRQALGHDLLKDPARSKEARLARDSGRLTLAGPFPLVQGGLGAAGRLPVFLKDQQGAATFWGFVVVVIRFPDVLVPVGLNELVGQGFHYELWRTHPDTGERQAIAASPRAVLIDPVTVALNLPNGVWNLSVSPMQGWRDPARLALWAALGLAFSLLATILAHSLVRLNAALRDARQAVLDHQRMEDALRVSEARFRSCFALPLIGMAITSPDKGWLEINDRMCEILGYSREALQRKTWLELTHPEDLAADVAQFDRVMAGALDSYMLEKRFIRADGSLVPAQMSAGCVRDAAGQPLYFIALVQDIAERVRLHEALQEQAVRDPLTGLFNRRYLDETLPREWQRSQRNGEPLAVAMLDLDHFKQLNDTHGHAAGDRVLRVVGDLLRCSLRAGDIACRYGGEEFILILPGALPADAWTRMDNMRQAIAELRIGFQGHDLPAVTASIGLAAAQTGEEDAAHLIGLADRALYRAKAQGRNRTVSETRIFYASGVQE